jgi:hypothetical protein
MNPITSFFAKYNAVPTDRQGRPVFSSTATNTDAVVAHARGEIAGWDAGVRTDAARDTMYRLAVEMELRRLRLKACGVQVQDRTEAEQSLVRLQWDICDRIGRTTIEVIQAANARFAEENA